jgi:N-acetylglutamate synthase-like GNAT family acetyltransferase
MSDIIFRPAHINDASAFTDLALRSKAYWGYDEAFMEACRAELTISADRIADEDMTVALSGETIIGMVALAISAQPQVLELEDMFVDPASIGTGIGLRLMDHTKVIAIAKGAIRVEVDADPNAQGFYERCGYHLIGTSPSASIPGRVLPRLALDLT